MSKEILAQWMIQHGYATGHGDTIEGLLTELEWQIREAEREACAKLLAEEVARQVSNDTNGKAAVLHCAFAIRERGAP